MYKTVKRIQTSIKQNLTNQQFRKNKIIGRIKKKTYLIPDLRDSIHNSNIKYNHNLILHFVRIKKKVNKLYINLKHVLDGQNGQMVPRDFCRF